MTTSERIKFDALINMHNKYIDTFTINAVTGHLYDVFDDEDAVKNELIKMDAKHEGDIAGVLTSDDYDDITVKPVKGAKRVLTDKGEKDLVKLTKVDKHEIEVNSSK
ncbi:hypothetical protein [Acetilactobacillus jinshanensis]|uniref:Uncharacterized protein n=1 Tax=Acetilactobacillus jinshanensis TaxID=1720083 RepID=A0A4P6ZL86_9LACO|nr:hypothetical protein [Acetilactobacillus jinshanensis]QBP18297.1 hypothetical protein ELX58_03915 [Acetilactobacillus jinshanensis]URL61162.1 hypothetical protein HGK75_03975 [uncultured bacterium]